MELHLQAIECHLIAIMGSHSVTSHPT